LDLLFLLKVAAAIWILGLTLLIVFQDREFSESWTAFRFGLLIAKREGDPLATAPQISMPKKI